MTAPTAAPPRDLPSDFHELPFVRSFVEEDPRTGYLWRTEVRGYPGLMVSAKSVMPGHLTATGRPSTRPPQAPPPWGSPRSNKREPRP